MTGKLTLREILAAAAASAEPQAEQALLPKCALLRWFDRRLFERVLQPKDQPGGASFAKLVKHPDISAVPGRRGWYYVKDAARETYLGEWMTDLPSLREFSAEAASYYGARQPIDRLAVLTFAEPARALEDYQGRYQRADKWGDLAACDDLLRILRNRSALVRAAAPALFTFLQDHEPYLRTRVLFVEDWDRSSHHLPRTELANRVDTFLSGTDWMLQLYAKGGFGKTAFLRWLIARNLVVHSDNSPRRAVARIDFDRVNRANIGALPSLLLIRAAEELDQQLSRGAMSSVFGSMLSSSRDFAPALQISAASGNLGVSVSASDVRALGFEPQFCAALGNQVAVLILDTIEELVIHQPENWLRILQMLDRVHKLCPGLKVIVSGRHDFRAREALQFWTRGVVGMQTEEVLPFGIAEALEYLSAVRELTPTFTDAEAKTLPVPAAGNPFKLALFADITGAGGRFSLDDLQNLQHVDVHYLIGRIIDRLPDCELQWTLRYAVVPNQLTREFLGNVLLDRLRREAANPDLDQPREHLPAGVDIIRSSTSWHACGGAFELNSIWERLKQYASSSSWIDFVGDVPKLQPELVVPMRYLLQSQRIHAPLHHAAAEYFEGKADEATYGTRGAFAVEALYHWFQAEGAAAEPHWRRLLDKYSRWPTLREQIAQSVFAGSFLDDTGRPLPHQGAGLMIGLDTLAEAHFETASALLRNVKSSDVSSIQQHLRGVADLEREIGRTVIRPERRALLDVRLLVHQKRPQDAIDLVDRTLQADIDAQYRVSLLVLKANALPSTDVAAVDRVYSDAWTLATDDPAPIIAPEWIRARQGRLWFDAADLARAETHYAASVRTLAALQPDPALLLKRVESLIEVLHQGARWSAIQDWIEFAVTTLPPSPTLTAFVATQQERFNTETLVPPPASNTWPSGALAILGRAAWLSTVFSPEVVSGQDLARAQFQSTGNTVGAEACEIEKLQYLAGALGNLAAARTFATKLQPSGPNWLRGRLALMELERQHNPDRAREIWNDLWPASELNSTVRERAAALSFALAGGMAPPAAVAELAALLSQVQPPEARVTLVTPFAMADSGMPPLPGQALADVLPALSPADPDFVQRVRRVADAFRLTGDRARAIDMLTAALAHPTGEPLLIRRELLLALERAGGTVDDEAITTFMKGVRAELNGFAAFVLTATVEQVEWLIEHGRYDKARELMAGQAEPSGERMQAHCRFYALRAKLADDRDTFVSWAQLADRTASPLGLPIPVVKPDAWPLPGGTPTKRPAPKRTAGATFEQLAVPGQTGLPFGVRADVITVRRPSEYVVVLTARSHDGQVAVRRCELQQWPNLAALLHSLGESSTIEAAIGDRADGAYQLDQLLSLSELLPQGPRPGVGLILQCEDDGLAGLPWEWSLNGRGWEFFSRTVEGDLDLETVRWVQSGLVRRGAHLLVDGVMGPQTRMLLKQFDVDLAGSFTRDMKYHFRQQIPRRPVALLCRPYSVERSYRLGYGAFGVDVEQLLMRSVKGEAKRLDPVSLMGGLESLTPEVLYIAVNVAQTGSALRLSFDRPGERVPDRPQVPDLTPMALNKALFALPPEIRPFVILDVPYDGSRSELLQLMYIRNQFAHQLLTLGRVRGVLATGLAGPATPVVGSTILESAAGTADAAQLLTNLGPITGDVPTALFTSDPTIPLW